MEPKIHFYQEKNKDINIREFAYSYSDRTKTVGPYVRDTYLLHIVISEVCHFCDFDAPEGSAFIIAKDSLHSFCIDKGYSHYWFSMEGEGLEKEFKKYGLSLKKHTLYEIKNFEYVKDILNVAMNYADNDIDVAYSAFRCVLSMIQPKQENNKHRDDEFYIAITAKRFMDNNYQHGINMEDVAKFIRISEKYLYRKFKECFHISPQQYLLSVRIERAKILLENTDFKIKEISASVGYKSQLTFTNAFKNKMGVCPEKYRNK